MLSAHYSLEDLLVSDTATRLDIDNTPDAAARNNLARLAQTLEEVHTALGKLPLVISSGYRSPRLNQAVGGAANSAHLLGLAVDFTVPHYGTVLQTAQAIAQAAIAFDKLIFEYGRWVHLAIADSSEQARGKLLSIGADRVYVDGLREV